MKWVHRTVTLNIRSYAKEITITYLTAPFSIQRKGNARCGFGPFRRVHITVLVIDALKQTVNAPFTTRHLALKDCASLAKWG